MRNGRPGRPDRAPARDPYRRARSGAPAWTVLDLFSGCGGMSCGFARRPPFRVVAAVDAEMAKPCEGAGKLGCNRTYADNIGVEPLDRDVAALGPEELLSHLTATASIRRGELT